MKHVLRVLIFTIIVDGAFSRLRIAGGSVAAPDEFPYVVSMVEKVINKNKIPHFSHMCTCALITPTWSLTAAHCLEGNEMKINTSDVKMKIVIIFGSFPHWNESEIISIISHPSYPTSNYAELHNRNDIGLIRAQPIIIKQYLTLSALDYDTLIGLKATAFGFGLTDSPEATNFNRSLQMAEIVIVPCYNGVELKPALCTVPSCMQSTWACPGDSGGPLIHTSGGIGVNSMGGSKYCSESKEVRGYDFGLMAPISPYINWITSQITDRSKLYV